MPIFLEYNGIGSSVARITSWEVITTVIGIRFYYVVEQRGWKISIFANKNNFIKNSSRGLSRIPGSHPSFLQMSKPLHPSPMCTVMSGIRDLATVWEQPRIDTNLLLNTEWSLTGLPLLIGRSMSGLVLGKRCCCWGGEWRQQLALFPLAQEGDQRWCNPDPTSCFNWSTSTLFPGPPPYPEWSLRLAQQTTAVLPPSAFTFSNLGHKPKAWPEIGVTKQCFICESFTNNIQLAFGQLFSDSAPHPT